MAETIIRMKAAEKAAESLQVVIESSSHVESQTYEYTGSAADEEPYLEV